MVETTSSLASITLYLASITSSLTSITLPALRCKWDADASSCKWNRDSKNNVCVRPPQGHADLPASVKNCAAIVSGQCPEPWEVGLLSSLPLLLSSSPPLLSSSPPPPVPRALGGQAPPLLLSSSSKSILELTSPPQVPGGCCLEEHMKYVGILYSRPGFVCCNAPCTSLAAGHTNGTLVDLQGVVSNVTTYTGEVTSGMVCGEQMGSSLCAPGMRSYFSGGGMAMPGMGGLMDRQMQYSTLGLYAGQPMQGGRVTQAYGSQGDDRLMRAMMSGLGGGMGGLVDLDEDVMESGVDEISIDDFMDVLIDALNTDADVFESDRQITTDPWFGRQDIGLGPVGVKLDDPMDIFDDIYGNLNFGQNSKNLLTSPYMSANDYTTSLYGTPQLAGQFPRTPFGAFGTGFNMSHNPLAPDDADDDSLLTRQMGMMGMMNMMGMSPMGAQQMSYIQPMPMQQQNPWLAMAMQQQQQAMQQRMQQQTAWQQNLPGQAWQGMPMQQQVDAVALLKFLSVFTVVS